MIDQAVEKAYGNQKKIAFKKLLAGEDVFKETGEWLPDTTLEQIKKYRVAIKGPLTTPVGHGMKSLNVTLCDRSLIYMPASDRQNIFQESLLPAATLTILTW